MRRPSVRRPAGVTSLALLVALVAATASAEDNPLAPGKQRLAPIPARDPAPPAWVGVYVEGTLDLSLAVWPEGEGRFAGKLDVQQQLFDVAGEVKADGTLRCELEVMPNIPTDSDQPYTPGQTKFELVAHVDGDVLVLTTDGVTYRLARSTSAARLTRMLGARRAAPARRPPPDPVVVDLKLLVTAETMFQHGPAARLGTLAELGKAGLIDPALASGTKGGYVFELRISTSSPTTLWAATARPAEPGPGRRCYVVNQAGAIGAADHPLPLPERDEDFHRLPDGATPVPR